MICRRTRPGPRRSCCSSWPRWICSQARQSTGGHALAVAEGILEGLPAEDALPARIAAALIRIALCRNAGDLESATAYAARAESLLRAIPPGSLTPHPAVEGHILLQRGIVELWRGDPEGAHAPATAAMAAAVSPDGWRDRTEYLGQLALAEALRGQLTSAVRLASEAAATDEDATEAGTPAANIALACVHVQRYELRQAHGALVRADAALRQRPDRFMGAVASLIAGQCRLAEGRPGSALELVGRARQGWTPPRWLDHRLTLLEARACAASGDAGAAANAARRAGPQSAPDASVALACASLAAGDHQGARNAAPVLATGPGKTDQQVSIERWLIEARLSYADRDAQRGRRALERALQLAGPEQIRLPFALERAWLRPVLGQDPGLARAYRELLDPDLVTPPSARVKRPVLTQAPVLVVDQLSDREREVLQRLSGMLSTAEIAAEMYISVNTVKTHLKSIYRKLSADHRGEAVRRARQLNLI